MADSLLSSTRPSTNLNQPKINRYSHIHVKISPSIDKSELQTLLTFSIQSLFGKCQLHFTQVLQCYNNKAVIKTESVSVDAVCAALTLSSISPITNQLYCVDIVKVDKA